VFCVRSPKEVLKRTSKDCPRVIAAGLDSGAAFAPFRMAIVTLFFAIGISASIARADDEENFGPGSAGTELGSDEDDGVPALAAARSSALGGLSIEGLLYRRKGLATVPFTEAGDTVNQTIGFTRFDSSDLQGRDYAPGLRMSLQASVLDQPIELSAFFVTPFSFEQTKLGMSSAGVADTDMVYANPTGTDIFSSAATSAASDQIYGLHAHHESKVYGGEANITSLLGIPGLTLGARGIYFGETLSTTTMDDLNAVNNPPPTGTTGYQNRDRVGIRVDNRLVGLQLGLQHMFDVGGGLRVGGSVKGGLYNNFVDRNRTFVSENRVDLRSFETSDHKDVFAQAVEFNPRVEFKLAEGTYLTASGQFLWLNNVSTALPQYDAIANIQNDHDVRAKDDVYFYGGSLGLTILLDESSPVGSSLPAFSYAGTGDYDAGGYTGGIDAIDERVAELETTALRKGNSRVSLEVSGWINRMALYWNDGVKSDVYIADNVASRSRVNFNGAAKIARGWSAGYFMSLGLDDQASNDLSQTVSSGDGNVELRHSAWWLRNNQLGTVTVGLTSTATDDIILKDVGGIMPGAANIATIGGSFMLRRSSWHEQGDGALVTNASGSVNTTLNDISGGASVDTLRRNAIRYDAPRFSGQWGNVDVSAAWGEDDFYDVAVEHSINYNDFKFRFGAGYLRDTTEGRVVVDHPEYFRDRREYKGSASILHLPTGLFGTAAYVRRTFHGLEEFDAAGTPGAVYGENTTGKVTPPGTNRPPLDYLYTAFGLRRHYWSIGDTSVYGEYARVQDAITGLREAGLHEVTDSTLEMLGAAISQDIDAAGMDVYAGVRVYSFDTEGALGRAAGNPSVTTYTISPMPLTDIMFAYAGTRIKF